LNAWIDSEIQYANGPEMLDASQVAHDYYESADKEFGDDEDGAPAAAPPIAVGAVGAVGAVAAPAALAPPIAALAPPIAALAPPIAALAPPIAAVVAASPFSPSPKKIARR
jgi:hypothetical protein